MNSLSAAVAAAKAAGKIHLRYFNTAFEIRTKGRYQDRVTIADIEAEKAIVSLIRKRFPGHNILAEESTYSRTASDYTWIIDPLDGTNNFSHALPIFSSSIALAKKGELIVGAVYDPIRKEMFTAEKGKGARLNGKIIRVTHAQELRQCLLVTGFYYDRSAKMSENLRQIERFFRTGILGIRRLGSAALDLCNVACGRCDGFWEFTLQPWDFAAGMLIVQEAQGKVTDRQGLSPGLKQSYIVASNGLIHEKMLKVMR